MPLLHLEVILTLLTRRELGVLISKNVDMFSHGCSEVYITGLYVRVDVWLNVLFYRLAAVSYARFGGKSNFAVISIGRSILFIIWHKHIRAIT